MPTPSENAATVSLAEAPVFGSFVSGVVLTFGTRLLMLAGVFGSGVIIARRLGDDGFGTYAVLSVTVALAVQIGSAGLPSATTYFVARDRSTVGRAWANAIVVALVLGTLLALSILALTSFRPTLFGGVSTRLLTIAAASIPFQLLTLLGLNVLLAIDRIKQLNLFDALSPAWVLVNAVVVLLILHEQLLPLITLNTAAAILLALILTLYLRHVIAKTKESKSARVDLKLLRATLSYGLKFYVSIMAAALIIRFDLLIVNYFRGASEAGVYGVAAQFSFLLLMLPGVIATLLFPRVASLREGEAAFTAKVTRHTTIVMLVTSLAAAGLAFLLPLIYGRRFADSTIQLLILLPGIIFMGLESVLVQYFTGSGLPRAIPVFWVITLAFNVVMNLLFVPTFGARAAAVNSSLSYALIFLLVSIYFCRQTGSRPAEIFLWRGSDMRALWHTAAQRLSGSVDA